ncbi:MAG: Uma2 family endonuclease [Thiolinea sp.]
MLAQNNFKQGISEADYLAGEKNAKTRHEYLDGKVIAMAGSSKRHNRITLNVVRALPISSPDGQVCEIYSSDMKVRAGKGRAYYYPDVVVSCAQDDADDYYLEQPCLIVEVTSKSTEWKDHNEKLLVYQSIASLKTYLVIAQDKPYVTHFYREEQGDWWVRTYEAMNEVISLPCPKGVELALTVIYAGVE